MNDIIFYLDIEKISELDNYLDIEIDSEKINIS